MSGRRGCDADKECCCDNEMFDFIQCFLPRALFLVPHANTVGEKARAYYTRPCMLRIDSRLVEREFRAWSGSDEARKIEFDMPPVDDIAKVGTLLRYMRMLCDDLRSEASNLSHRLVAVTAWHRDWSLFS